MMIKLLTTLALIPFAAYGDLNEAMLKRFNDDYIKVSQLRSAANPERKDLEALIAKKNADFLDALKKRVTSSELKKIASEISSAGVNNSAKIEKEYLKIFNENQANKLSEDDQKQFNELTRITQIRLHKGVDFAALSKANKQKYASVKKNSVKINAAPVQEVSTAKIPVNVKINTTVSKNIKENADLKQSQADLLVHAKLEQRKLKPEEDDSLFNIITKAYHRNVEKIIPLN